MSPAATSQVVSCSTGLNEMALVAARHCVITAKIATETETILVMLRVDAEMAFSSAAFMAVHQLPIQSDYHPLLFARGGPASSRGDGPWNAGRGPCVCQHKKQQGAAGTPFKSPVWRLVGMRIGRRVFDDGCGIAERTLVSIGDYCTLNAGSVIQCHSMEDGIFKADSCPTTSSPTTADLNRRPSSHTHVTDVANGRDQRADAICARSRPARL
jgi:hypothetical protein